MISVVIPVFNKRDTLVRALKSVLRQTYQKFEVLVVNDGSTDDSVSVIKGIQDARIRLIEQPNSGVSVARNRGVESATYELIAFLDADDEWLPELLERLLQLRLDFPNVKLWGSSYYFNNPRIGRRPALLVGKLARFRGRFDDYFDIASKSEPPIWTSAVLVEKTAILSIGGFPPGVRAGEDLLTWARIAHKYGVAYYAIPLAIFYGPMGLEERSFRLPPAHDVVGEGLHSLLNEAGSDIVDSLRAYVALWHRMRAVTFLQAGKRRSCLLEVMHARRLIGLTPRLLCIVLLLLSPKSTTRLIVRRWHQRSGNKESLQVL